MFNKEKNGKVLVDVEEERQPEPLKFFEGVALEVAGIKFTLRAPSFWLNYIISKHKNNLKNILVKEFAKSKDVFQAIADEKKNLDETVASKKSGANPSEQQSEKKNTIDDYDDSDLEALFNLNDRLLNENERFPMASDDMMFRFIQLLILDAMKPEWIDDHKTYDMPEPKILDEIVTMDKLKKRARGDEVAHCIKIFNDLQKKIQESRGGFQNLITLTE